MAKKKGDKLEAKAIGSYKAICIYIDVHVLLHTTSLFTLHRETQGKGHCMSCIVFP